MLRALPAGYNAGDTVYCYFPAYDSNGASVTITGLAVTDIEVYKNGSTTQRASDNGYSLLDTDGIDFDSSTGLHGFSVDTSDNSDSGFWVDGSHYIIWVDAVTIDSQTVRFGFELRLGVLLRPVTAGRELAVDASGYASADVIAVSGDTTAADNLEADYDGTGYNKSNSTIGTCTTNTDMRGTDSAATASALSSLVTTVGAAGAGLTEAGGTGDHLTAIPWNASWDAEVQSECTDALNAYDPPTKTEMDSAFTEIKGATWSASTDTLEAIRDQGDSAWITATGFSTHSAADVRTEMDSNSTQLASIVEDTTELQADWEDGGRLDLILDSAALKTGYKLASDGLDSVVIETGMNARQAISIQTAAAAGVLSGAATTTVTIAAAGVPATNRITATVDADGNRSGVTLSLPS